MKKHIILLTVALLTISFCNAQAFIGNGDNKIQIGVNTQKNATGIMGTYDFGIGENMSVGVFTAYALGINDEIDANVNHRFDLKARFNANIGNVINIDKNFDIYPGLHLGLKNFGGHLGMRYFFNTGFGIFTEFAIPFAKYKTETLSQRELIHNQFTANFGACFNLN